MSNPMTCDVMTWPNVPCAKLFYLTTCHMVCWHDGMTLSKLNMEGHVFHSRGYIEN